MTVKLSGAQQMSNDVDNIFNRLIWNLHVASSTALHLRQWGLFIMFISLSNITQYTIKYNNDIHGT